MVAQLDTRQPDAAASRTHALHLVSDESQVTFARICRPKALKTKNVIVQ